MTPLRSKKLQTNIDPRVRDFRNFLYLTWKHLNLPSPTPVQNDIAKYVQDGPRRMVIQAFRGVGKSWITSAFVVHQLLLDPTLNFLVVSASKTRSDDFSTFTLRLISEMPILQHLKPSEDQRSSKISFDVGPAPAAHAPSVKSVGITGQLTGSRADIIVADDVESANNSMTQLMRDRLGETVKEFEAILKPEGRIIFLGTPQSEETLYNALLERGYETRIWPARYPSKTREIYGDRLCPTISLNLQDDPEEYQGKPVDPLRFNEIDLAEREASYGKAGFALQFMLDSRLSDLERYPLKLSDFIVHPLDREVASPKLVWASSPDLVLRDVPNVGFSGDYFHKPMEIAEGHEKYTGAVMAIDPSGRGQDETGYAVVKILASQLFVTEAGGFKGGYDKTTLIKLAKIAKENKVNRLIIEANFGDGMFNQLLKPVLAEVGYSVTVEEVRHNKQKELRIIDTLEPLMNSHRLILDPRVIIHDYDSIRTAGGSTADNLSYLLLYQLSRLTRDKGSLRHDDRLDALSMACGYWVEHMAQSVDEAVDALKNDRIDRELERFLEGVVGRKPEGNLWMNI